MKLEPVPRKRKYLIRSSVARSASAAEPTAASDPARDLEQIAQFRHGRTREDLIRDAAYARAAERGFRDGDPVEDWLAAEAEVDARLLRDEGLAG